MKSKKTTWRRVKAAAVSTALAAGMLSSYSAAPIGTVSAKAEEINFAKALQYSLFFYDANMCGTDVSENNLYSWRDDCHAYDAQLPLDTESTNMTSGFIAANKDALDPDGDGFINVQGGFHDAGDHVKFGMPEGYSGATVGWGYYEFRDAYKATGQDAHTETILRYFNDYFMRCTFRDKSGDVVAFCYQVGDGDIDHAYWQAPENDEMFRRGWFAYDGMPATDCIAIAIASLAYNYLNFKDTDPTYAAENLDYAEALYEYINKMPKDKNADGPKGYYGSNKWEDDYCWASSLLYMCTKNDDYLEKALSILDFYAASCWAHCWNDTWAGATCMLAEIDDATDEDLAERYKTLVGKSPYEDIKFWDQIAKLGDNWMNGGHCDISPAGYSFLQVWGSARYNTSAQLTALIYDKHNGTTKYSEWAKSQMIYLMGENPLDRCYIVGYASNSAKYPHHRAASGLPVCEDPGEHRHVLYGALVGGPDANDQHSDTTADWIYNEVTIDYNAAFVGACAGLYEFFGDSSMQPTPDFPPIETTVSGDPTTSNKYWVEAFSVEIAQQDGPKASEITLFVRSNAAKVAKKGTSIRYYFDASGMSSVDPNQMEIRQLYDQTAAETDYAAELSGPHLYKGNVYYIEVEWPDYPVANSNKKYQFALGTYSWGNSWNPSDDWSHQDIKAETDAFAGTVEETPYICVYVDDVLVGGIEPDGTTPMDVVTTTTTSSTTSTSKTTEPTTVTTTEPTTTSTSTSYSQVSDITSKVSSSVGDPQKTVYGDVNLDGKVTAVDVIPFIKHFLDKPLTGQSILNADVVYNGKIELTDLATLKQYSVGDNVKLGK